MQIALYSNHHYLPFWSHPKQPDAVFDPNAMSDWQYGVIEGKPVPVKETWVWPIMIGLVLIELPIMAHVSATFAEGRVEIPHRMWVQITTLPREFDPDGFPLVVKEDVVQVKSLWGRDNGTYDPRQLFAVTFEERMRSSTWKNFFEKSLREARSHVEKTFLEAERALRVYDVIQPKSPYSGDHCGLGFSRAYNAKRFLDSFGA